jgi:hypothetical protein
MPAAPWRFPLGGFGTAVVCYLHVAICGDFLDRGALVIESPCLYGGQTVRAEEGLAGRHVECFACGHSVRVRERKVGDARKTVSKAEGPEKEDASCWAGRSDRESAESLLARTMTKKQRQEQAVKKAFSFLTPRYDDLTLFALSLSFLLLWWIPV